MDIFLVCEDALPHINASQEQPEKKQHHERQSKIIKNSFCFAELVVIMQQTSQQKRMPL